MQIQQTIKSFVFFCETFEYIEIPFFFTEIPKEWNQFLNF